MTSKSLYCLIMAGGVGSRFWPLSTDENPKQFLDFLGTGQSLLQMTFARFVNTIPKENIFILTNEAYSEQVVHQLNVKQSQVICEPQRKNTAPCIAFATAKILEKDENATLVVTPADHLITNEQQFNSDLDLAINTAKEKDQLVTFGIKPHRPDTGYGYIEFNDSNKAQRVQKVLQFREKPDLNKAEEFLNAGNFYWNSGMFVWRGSVLKESFEKYCPEMFDLFFANGSVYNTSEEQPFCEASFQECSSISIDYAIMEKEKNVVVILSKFGWSDLGTWGSIQDIREKDSNGNTQNHNDIHFFESKNCFVYSKENKKTLVDGLHNFIVVDTSEKLMILKRDNEQRLKTYLQELDAKK
ncbi:MAG: mannose-1-phosphate guanylyltransferase [Cryomorphaceae bacterium]|nr:mannose-1-phosphate guanylyltransferase [Cryomorphaceae bacterium]|tara:strand:- start:6795 stop:7862 length:1068 start_codon:yes stop_codon:yes gene_type:complete